MCKLVLVNPHRVNNLTGERTYAFVGGSPVSPVGDPMISPYYNMQTSPAPWGYGMPRPVAIPPPPGFNRVMVPYPEGYMGCGVPPVTPEGNGGLFHRMQKYYIRSSSEPRSWMWR